MHLEPIKRGLGLALGIVTGLLGGFDVLLQSLIFLLVTDIVLGTLASVYKKKFDPDAIWKGSIKKISTFVLIAMAVQLDKLYGTNNLLRDIFIWQFLIIEFSSNVKNSAILDLPIPKKIIELFDDKYKEVFGDKTK